MLICILLGAIGAINSNEIAYERVKIVGHNGEILSDQSNGSPFFLNESGKVEFYQDLGLQEDGSTYVETLIAVPEGDEGTRYTTVVKKEYPTMPEIGIDPAPVINEESCEPISDDLRLTLLGKNPDESIRIIITLKEQPEINNLQVNRFLEYGLNDLYQERVIERRELIEQRKEDVFSLQENLIDEVNALDGVLYKQFWLVNAIAVEMLPEQILELNSHPDVANVELDTTATFLDDGDGQNYVTMVDVRRVTQSEYYRDANPDRYEGQNPSGRVDIPGVNESRLVVAVIDGQSFDEDHYALNDGSTHYNPSKRIIARYDCVDENGSCVTGQLDNSWAPVNEQHSMRVS